MNLLKDVAKDRLVVMVTHNPELAEQYATRIVNLRDGVIRSDSDPFVVDETAEQPAVYKTMGRASMSFATSLALSFNNLKTKKARTLLTSFAGSIGIIGIALILSVSTGVNTYISDIQRDTMTAYPITVDSQTFDLSSMMGGQMGGDDGYGGKTHKTDGIYPDDRSVKQASSLTSSITENNLTRFKKYLDNSKSEIHQYVGSTGIQYTYDVKFSVFDHDPDGTLVNADGVTIGSSDSASMASQMASTSSSGMSGTSSITSQQMSMLTGKTDENAAPDSFNEIMPGADDSKLVGKVITDNYQVVNGSWPKSKDEVVLVLDDNNSVPLTTLYELGLLPASDYHEMMSKLNAGDKVSTPQDKIDYAKALDQTLYMIPASDQYVKGDDGHYRFIGNDKDEIEQRLETATKLKVVGVVKAKKDASATPLAAGVGYARALTNDLIDRAASSAIVTDQKANPEHERAQRHDVLALGRCHQGVRRAHLRGFAGRDAEGEHGQVDDERRAAVRHGRIGRRWCWCCRCRWRGGCRRSGRRHGRDERTAARRQFRRVYRHGFERRACRDLRPVRVDRHLRRQPRRIRCGES